MSRRGYAPPIRSRDGVAVDAQRERRRYASRIRGEQALYAQAWANCDRMAFLVERAKCIRALRFAGFSWKQIAKELGLSAKQAEVIHEDLDKDGWRPPYGDGKKLRRVKVRRTRSFVL